MQLVPIVTPYMGFRPVWGAFGLGRKAQTGSTKGLGGSLGRSIHPPIRTKRYKSDSPQQTSESERTSHSESASPIWFPPESRKGYANPHTHGLHRTQEVPPQLQDTRHRLFSLPHTGYAQKNARTKNCHFACLDKLFYALDECDGDDDTKTIPRCVEHLDS